MAKEASYLYARKMKQSRLGSAIETCVNVGIGYIIALCSQLVIFPFFDINIPLSSNLAIGGYMTIVSVIRSYCVRRWFNKYLHKFATKAASKIE